MVFSYSSLSRLVHIEQRKEEFKHNQEKLKKPINIPNHLKLSKVK